MLKIIFIIFILGSLYSAIRHVFYKKTNDYSNQPENFIYLIFVLELAFYIVLIVKFPILIGIFAILCFIGYNLILSQYIKTKQLVFSPENKISYYTRICEIILYVLLLFNLIIK